MIFHAHERDLDFVLDGRRYVVPHGHEVEIPDRVAYCIAGRGICLKPGPAPSGKRVDAVTSGPSALSPAEQAGVDVAEELADVTGEDPPADGAEADDDSDAMAAQRTADALERQGIRLPGRRPGKRRE